MIRSMTAFSRKEAQQPWGTLSWELRSVNHRYLEVSPRLPEELRTLETAVRALASRFLKRGKLDATLRFQATVHAAAEMAVNKELAAQLVRAVREIESILARSSPLDAMEILSWPGVLEIPEMDFDPVRQQALALLEEALAELVETRDREGEGLRAFILERCDAMHRQVERVRACMPGVLSHLRNRLMDRFAEVKSELDPNRLEQELVILAQKLDVDEEMARLRAHITEVRRVLDQDQPAGRRLDFLMQELNREANTLGSKSADVETTRASVEMKVLIEQMREQVQNIE